MPRRTSTVVATRRQRLVDLLATHEGLTPAALLAKLPGRVARRTLHEDLAFLQAAFPDHVVRARAGAGNQGRVAYRWQGPVPRLLLQPMLWMTEEELLALVAARGFLHHDDKAIPATSGTARSLDGLAASVHRLIERTGLTEPARGVGRHLVSVSRFGAAPINPTALSTCLAAAASNQAVTFSYTNLDGASSQPHAVPQRLVLIRGEWYCVAWAGMLRMFRLARMAEVVITAKRPKGTPTTITSQSVDDLLALSFYATGSSDPQRRCRVVLAVCPGAWPFIQGRTWGASQRVDEAPKDLPKGWRRLSFVTTGLAECRHWMLGMGSGVRAEQPAELVDWMRIQAQALAAIYQGPT